MCLRHFCSIVDGAHNPGAARVLEEVVKNDFSYKRLILVLGVMSDKDIRSIVKEIAGMADHVICSSPEYYRSAKPEDIYRIVSDYSKKCEIIKSIPDAIDRARKMAKPDDMILITGSLFTVGEALTAIDPVKYKPDGV